MAFNKLVRDRIPEIIAQNGERAITKVLDDMEYSAYLEKKLDEEVVEYHQSKKLEELADILEVVYALCEMQGYCIDELKEVYEKKHLERGGFSKRVFLIDKK